MVFLASALPITAQQSAPAQDLTNASLEDLMNIQVTSVSKTEQKLSNTAAAVFVIAQEDIQRLGATNIPDLLRMAPGVDVAQISANRWAISIRGLNGLFSNELLVLLDGRTVYTPTFGGVLWDALDVPLEDIERIEVIRGPGGAVWGANAVNGVINIITKNASATRGTMAVMGGGNLTPEFGTLQHGGGVGQATDYRVFAKYFNQNLSPGVSGSDGADGWHVLRGGFRTDSSISTKDRLTFEGDVYEGREGIVGPVLTSVTAPGPQETDLELNLSGGFFHGVWNHASSDRSDSTLQFSYNRYERDDIFDETRGTFDLNFQNHIAVRTRHDIVWGAEAETSGSRTRGSLFVSFDPANIRTELFGAFVQDEIALASGRVHLALGAKLEHNHYSSFNVMPTARLAWALNERNTLWTAISRGVRTPAETDASVRVNLMGVSGPGGAPALVSLIGNPQVKDENLLGVEAGYRTTIRARLSADLALYYDNYTSQETQEPSTTFLENTPAPAHLVFPETFENLMNGEAHGFEIFAKWKVANRWTVSPGYAFEQVHMHLLPGSQDTSAVSEAQGSAPVHSAQLRSHVALPDRFSWDTSAYFTGRIADPAVPSYTRLDMILSWQPQERLFFSVVGQNLLKDRHLEYADATDSVASTLMKRSVYAKLTWTF